MKKLYIKQKISFREKFTVTDETQNMRYEVVGKILTVGRKATITNTLGTEVARIEEKIVALMPKYELIIGKEVVATIQQKVAVANQKYKVTCKGVEVKGDLMNLNFTIMRNGESIGAIKRKVFASLESFEVDIYDDSCELLVTTLVLAIAFANEFGAVG